MIEGGDEQQDAGAGGPRSRPDATGELGRGPWGATLAGVPTVNRIAAARDESEVHRRGAALLAEILAPARCLVFGRDTHGQSRLAYRWDEGGAPGPATGPLEVADQVRD